MLQFPAGDYVNANQIVVDNTIIDESHVYAINTLEVNKDCSTVWFDSVCACRAFIRVYHKVPNGKDVGLCDQCRCNYDILDPRYYKYNVFACIKYKETISKISNELLKKQPLLGRAEIDYKLLNEVLEEKKF